MCLCSGGVSKRTIWGAIKKEFFVKDGIKVYEQKNAIYQDANLGSYFISVDKYKELKRFEVKEGDFVISCSGTIGKIFQVPKNAKTGVINQALLKIKTDSRVIHDRFFFYVFDWDEFQQKIIDNTQGGAMPNLVGMDIFRNISIPLPPFSEQQAIATALGDIDAMITSLNKFINKKRDIKQATMQQILTGKMRLPGFSGKWEVKKLEDVADKSVQWCIAGGPFGSNLKTTDYVADGVRIIQLQNIGDGVFHDDYKIYTSEEKADELISCNIYPGEIILSKMGDPVARACIVPSGNHRYLMASDGIRLVVNKKYFDKRFVHDYINSVYFRKKAIEASTGSTRQRIGLEDLKHLPFVAPSLSEQQAIATILSDVDAEIAALEQKRDKFRVLKQGMMQELLTGKTRLLFA